MGSPVSVVVANLVMEHVEKLLISSFVRKPRFWKRYVDDVCCSVQECDVNDLLVHLNSIEPSVQFTCEVEKNRHLPYLDILLEHNLDGTISTRVCRKLTHTERYLDFSSHHPPAHKAAVVKSLFDRADRLSSCPEYLSEELDKIHTAMASNNYPRGFVKRVLNRHAVKTEKKKEKTVLLFHISMAFLRQSSVHSHQLT